MRNCARMRSVIWAMLLIAASASPLRADYVSRSYQFDLSDSLPLGLSFGSAVVEAYDGVGPANGLNAGQVRMTFQAAALADYGPTDKSFGFQQLGFNSKLDLKDGQIQVPDGWKLRSNRFMGSWGGFGLFRWQAYGDPAVLNGPLTINVNDLGKNATIDNFAVGSLNSSGNEPFNGSVFFAGRIGGFDLNDDFFDLTSHVAAVSVPPPWITLDDPIFETGGGLLGPTAEPMANPEPGTLILAFCGVGAIGLRRWWTSRIHK